MFAFFGEQETLLSEVLYAYDDKGKLLSTAYYSIPFGSNKRELKYTKVYHGQNYVIYDYTPPPDDGVRSALESIEREVKRLQKLEKRGLIKKILGWE